MDHAQPVPAEPPAQFDILAAEDEGGAEDMRADQQSAGPGNDGVVDIAVQHPVRLRQGAVEADGEIQEAVQPALRHADVVLRDDYPAGPRHDPGDLRHHWRYPVPRWAGVIVAARQPA